MGSFTDLQGCSFWARASPFLRHDRAAASGRSEAHTISTSAESAVLVTMVSGSRFQPFVWARLASPRAAPRGSRPCALTAPTRIDLSRPSGTPMMAEPHVALAVGPAR